MKISHWPRADRPREKLLEKGEESLTDAELLAIFLRTGFKDKTAVDLAKSLLTTHGSLKQLLLSSKNIVLQTKGIGPAKYSALKAAIELGRRYLNEVEPKRISLKNYLATHNFLKGKLSEAKVEVFACIFLDVKLKVIHFAEVFKGGLDEVTVYPREVVRQALSHHAASVILAHNHPSGDPAPSQADKELTLLMQKALGIMDIKLLDHIIIGGEKNFSFAAHGLI